MNISIGSFESVEVCLLCFSVLFLLPGHNKIKDITVVETNYTEYAIVVKYKTFHREYTQVALYGETHTHDALFFT